MFFITIEDFDQLMSLEKKYAIPIEDILERAVADNGDPKTIKFDFSQHIKSLRQTIDMPKYLQYGVYSNLRRVLDQLENSR